MARMTAPIGPRLMALATASALAALAAVAPGASATIRVESTLEHGLQITDKNGTFDDNIAYSLESGPASLEWHVSKTGICGIGCVDVVQYEAGPGCRIRKVVLSDVEVICQRLGASVTANLAGGDDELTPARGTLTIADPFLVTAGSGDDHVVTYNRPDTVNGRLR